MQILRWALGGGELGRFLGLLFPSLVFGKKPDEYYEEKTKLLSKR